MTKFDLAPVKYSTQSICLPFDGFYNSSYSQIIDDEEAQWVRDALVETDHEDDERNFPEEIRLNESELSDLAYKHSRYGDAYIAMAKDYVVACNYVFGKVFGLYVDRTRPETTLNYTTKDFTVKDVTRRVPTLRLAIEEMTSPRKYNFETDRIFARIPTAIVKFLFWGLAREKHSTLARMIKDRFTSCSGFISNYSTDLADWIEDPVSGWDHNQVGTLLLAALEMYGEDFENLRDRLYESTTDCRSYWADCVDWDALNAERLEMRCEKLAAWCASDRAAVAAFRAKRSITFAAILAAGVESDRAAISGLLGEQADTTTTAERP